MKLTKKHFEYTAGIIRSLNTSDYDGMKENEILMHIANHFANAYERLNPNFNRLKFLNACRGIRSWEHPLTEAADELDTDHHDDGPNNCSFCRALEDADITLQVAKQIRSIDKEKGQ